MVIGRLVTHRLVLCALVLGAAPGVDAAQAQVVGGDVRFGTWNVLHGEHERWPEIAGRTDDADLAFALPLYRRFHDRFTSDL